MSRPWRCSEPYSGKCPTNVTSYSALMSACEKGKQLEQALHVSRTKHLQGVVPNVITCNALISGFEKGQQPEQAL